MIGRGFNGTTAHNSLFFAVLVVGLFWFSAFPGAFAQEAEAPESEWLPELVKMEEAFLEFGAQTVTLNEYAPEKNPDFADLEKINQLVEKLDFNKRKFDLLIKQFNVLDDELFPFMLKYAKENPGEVGKVYAKLKEYTGDNEKSIIILQKQINSVALQIERLEKQIERLQIKSREKEIEEESKQSTVVQRGDVSISGKIVQLEQDRSKYEAKLELEKQRLAEFKEKETKAVAKIDEKKAEILEFHKKRRKAANLVERLNFKTSAQVREERVNGLEIPRLNTLKTFIYLSDTAIKTLQEQIENIGEEIEVLKEQRKDVIINKLIKGVIIVAIAIFMALLLIGIARRIAKKIVKRVEESEKVDAHQKQRVQTLSSVTLSFFKVLIWVMAVIWVLGELEIDYAPFLVAAGGVSLAIGFGAQSLVKDVVTGFFMLMEEQFALGDAVEINGEAGSVENISLRTIKFRSLDGTLHIIPNGNISKVANKTYQWSRVVVNVGTSYDDDPQKVLDVLGEVCTGMKDDPQWKDDFIEDPTPQGILSFGDSCVNFRIIAKTYPGKQWAIGREMHIRIFKAFSEAGIDIPYNYINVVDKTPKQVGLKTGTES